MTPWQKMIAVLEDVRDGRQDVRDAAHEIQTLDLHGDFQYVVKKKGRNVAAFVHASDAREYVDHPTVGKQPFGRTIYRPEDFEMREVRSDRKVVGTTGHGHAILAALDRAEAAASEEMRPEEASDE